MKRGVPGVGVSVLYRGMGSHGQPLVVGGLGDDV